MICPKCGKEFSKKVYEIHVTVCKVDEPVEKSDEPVDEPKKRRRK